MNKQLLILALLLLIPLALAQGPNAQVHLQAPNQALPGQTIDLDIETTIQGVRVLSVPLEVTVTWPDNTQTTLETTPDNEGIYHAQLYTPQEGAYLITATAEIANQEFSTEHELHVQRPTINATLTTNQTHISVQADEERTYQVRVLTPRSGPLEQAPVSCTITCAECSEQCLVEDDLAYITTQDLYEHSFLLSAQEEQTRTVRPGEAINTEGWYKYESEALTSLPATTSFTQDQTLIDAQARIVHLIVDDQEFDYVQAPTAFDVQTGNWYARYTGNQTGELFINYSVQEAWTLSGEPLTHTENSVTSQEPFEARIQTTTPAPLLPNTTQTSYGTVINPQDSSTLRLHANTSTPLSLTGTQAAIQTHTDLANRTVYYTNQPHVRVQATLLNDSYKPATTQQPVTLNPPENTTSTRVVDENLQSVFNRQEATTQWTPQLPAGRYFALYTTPNQTYAQAIELFAADQVIQAGENRSHSAQPNTQLTLERTLRNLDYQNPRTINIDISSEYRVLLEDAQGNRLTDSNLNGVPDTGVLAPGEEKTVYAQVLLPPSASNQSMIQWKLSSGDEQVLVEDEVRIQETRMQPTTDLAVTQLHAHERAVTVDVYNFDEQPRSTSIRLTYTTEDGEDSSQHSINVQPGASEHTYSTPPRTTAVHAQLLIDDEDPANNERTIHTATRPGVTIPVSEQRGVSHDEYRIKAQVPSGEWSAYYPLANGSFEEARVAVLDETSRDQELLVELPLPARTDLEVALVQETPSETVSPYEIMDNRDERVSTTGRWVQATQVPGFYGQDYLHDLDAGKGDKQVMYTPQVEGVYEVEIAHPGDSLFASNTRVEIGETTILLNQKRPSQWRYLGRYDLGPEEPVVISNAATDGFVVADAIRLLRVDQYAQSRERVVDEEAPASARSLLYDSRGQEVAASVTLRRGGAVVRGGLLPSQARANNERFEVDFDFPAGSPVRNVRVLDANPSEMRLGVEPILPSHAQGFTNRRVADSFAINPEFDSNYTFTREATGRELLKCTDYDFDNQACLGDFEHVMYLTPGEEYTAMLDPRDPLFVEVTDELIPPVEAVCNAGSGWGDNCAGTYTDNPSCGFGEAHLLCDDGNIESFTASRDSLMGVDARYADVDTDPSDPSQCSAINSVTLEYRWSGTDVESRDIEVQSAASGGFVNTGCTPDDGLYSCDVTTEVTWSCEDFFGESSSAHARLSGMRTSGGGKDPQGTLDIDYLVFLIDYELEQQPLTTDSNNFDQGEIVTFSGADIWDANEDVRLNLTLNGVLMDQLDVVTDAEGAFETAYQLGSYQETGTYEVDAWQLSDPSIEAETSFNVHLRVPTVSATRTGNYYNRSETVTFTGSSFANNETILIGLEDPEGNELELTPETITSNEQGDFIYNYTISDDESVLTGRYMFFFEEQTNSSYSDEEEIRIVILSSDVFDYQSIDFTQEAFLLDGDYARFTAENLDGQYMQFNFPPAVPSGVELKSLEFEFFHVEPSNAPGSYIEWFNPGTSTWENVCTFNSIGSIRHSACNLTTQVSADASYPNQVQIRVTDNDAVGGNSEYNYDIDIAYLSVDFTFPPPQVTALSPANNSWFSSQSHELFFEAENEVFDIAECRVYVNDSLMYTNDSFTNPGSDSYAHVFSEGVNTWRAECTGTSGRALTGSSGEQVINVDLTDPEAQILTPGADFEWFNTSTPNISFTASDNLDPEPSWSLYVDSSLDQSGVIANDTVEQATLAALTDGLYEVTLEVQDAAGRFADNQSVQLYVDTTPPTVTLNQPVDLFNTSSTEVTFNWSASDNLAPNTTCDLRIDGAVEQGGFVVSNASSEQTTVSGIAEGVHNWSVACSDEANNTALSEVREFTVDTTPPVVQLEVPLNETVFSTTRDTTLEYNVTDNLLAVEECRLYVDDSLEQTASDVEQGVTQSFNLPTLPNGVYAWNVACTDTVGNAANSTQRVFEVRVTAQAISPANGTIIDRDGAGPDPETIDLVASLGDDQSGVTVEFYANQTSPQTTSPVLLGTATSNATGQATFTYNPDSTVFAGNYSWWPAADTYANDTPRTYYVFGTPTIDFQDPAQDPNSVYNVSQVVGLNATVSSAPESDEQLDTLYGLVVNATLTQPDSTARYELLTGQGILTGSYEIPGDAQIGVWDVVFSTQANWLYSASTTTQRNFTVRGAANTLSPANGTVVDRDGVSTDPDSLTLVAQIPQATSGVLVNFTADLTDPVIAGEENRLLGQNTTNATGHATYTFTPDTTYYLGLYEWRAESEVSFVNTSSTFIIKGAADVTRSDAVSDPNASYNQTDTVVVRMDVSGALESEEEFGTLYDLTTNATIQPNFTTSPRYTPTLNYNGTDWLASQAIGLTDPVGEWVVVANTSGAYVYASQSQEYFFTLRGLSNLTLASDTDTQTKRVYEEVNFTGNYSDTSDQPITGATCEIRFNTSSGWTGFEPMSFSDDVYWYARSFEEVYEDALYNVVCDASLYEAQDEESTFTIDRTQAHVVTAPGQRVDRDGVGPDPQSLDVTARILEAPAGVEVEFYTNLSSPALGQTDTLLATALTNSSGFATFTWNPDETIFAGNHTLFANASVADTGNVSDAEVFGGINSSFFDSVLNPDANYTQNQSAAVQAAAQSPPASAQQLATSYALSYVTHLQSPVGTDSVSMSFVDPYWESVYSLLDLTGVGVWNASINASAQYHYAGSSERAFDVFGFANVTESVLTPGSHFVYGSATQECRVQDQHTAVAVAGVEVEFYRNSTLVGSNTTNSSGWAQLTFQTNESGLFDVSCVVVDTPSVFYFAGSAASSANGLDVTPFPITPTSPVNDTQVDRDGVNAGTADDLELVVEVPSYVPDGTVIEFYSNLTSPEEQSAVLLGSNTTQAGTATLRYEPATSSRAGMHVWYADSADGAANGSLTYESIGSLSVAYTSSSDFPPANYTQNATVQVRLNVTSPGPESVNELNSLYTTQPNTSLFNPASDLLLEQAVFVDPFWSASTALIPPGGVGVWNTSSVVTASHFFDAMSATRSFDVYGFMNVTESVLTPGSHFVYGSATQECRVQDQHTAVDVAGAEVEFYRNTTLLGTNTTNSSGWAQLTFSTNESGSYDVTCLVEDQPGIYYFAGDASSLANSLFVEPFPITPIDPVNGTQVDRDGVDASINDSVELVVEVPGFVSDGTVIEFYSNLTQPHTQPAVLLGSNVTQAGVARFRYEPATSSYAGNHTWYAQSTDGVANGSRIYTSIGSLDFVYASSVFNPDVNYTQNETATLQLNLTSPGLESREDLESLYAAVVDVTINSPVASDTRSASLASSLWSTSIDLLDLSGVGVWNASGDAQAQFFLPATAPTRSFDVYGFMNVTESVLTPSTHFAYDQAVAECRVQDQHTAIDVAGAEVEFYRNSTLIGSDTTNSSGWAQLAFSTNETGNYGVTCVVEDQLGIYYFAGDAPSATNNLLVEPFPVTPTSPVNDTQVDRDGVDAGTADSITLEVAVPSFVPDGVAIEFSSNLTNPEAQPAVLLGSNTTQAGVARFSYDPATSSRAGMHVWSASSDQGATNGTRTYESIGSLDFVYASSVFNPDVNYTQNETTTLELNLTSPGPESRDELSSLYAASVEYVLEGTVGNLTGSASFLDPLWSASSSLIPPGGVGVWSAHSSAQVTHFFDAQTTRDFEVFGFMNVTDYSLNVSTKFVFQEALVECRVQDQDTDVDVAGVNVDFYQNTTLLGTNATNSSGWAQYVFESNETGLYDISCAIEDQTSSFYLAGNQVTASDELRVAPYPVTPVSPANGTQVDRDGSNASVSNFIELVVEVPSYVSDGDNITFTGAPQDPIAGANQTLGYALTSNGTATLSYEPLSSTRAGEWEWFAETTGDPGGADGTRLFESVLTPQLAFSNSSTNPALNYTQNSTADFLLNLTSLGPESRDDLASAFSSSVDFTLTSPSGTDTTIASYASPAWSASYALLDIAGVGVWNVTATSSGAYQFSGESLARSFEVYGFMNVTESVLSPNQHAAYQTTTQECRVQDQHTAVAVAGAEVEFYRNSTLVGSNTTNGTGWAQLTFSTNETGSYDVTCVVEDQTDIYYFAGDAPSMSNSLLVEPFPITPISPANSTQVDRDGVNAGTADDLELVVEVPSYVPDGVSIEFSSNLTTPDTRPAILLGSNVTQAGTATLRYEPATSSYAGMHVWYADSADGAANGTRTYESIGSLDLVHASSVFNPDANYTQNATAQLDFNLTTPGPENRSLLASSYAALINTTLQSTAGSLELTPSFIDPLWSASTALIPPGGVGVWNTSSVATASHFFDATSVTRGFDVYGFMNVTESLLTPNEHFAYDQAVAACRVQDQHTAVDVAGAEVEFYRNSTLVGSNTTNSSGWAQLAFSTNETGSYDVTCVVEDQTDIYYFAGDAPSATNSLLVEPFPITPTSPVNDTAVDRDGVDASTPDALALTVSVPSFVPDGVVIEFSSNLTDPEAQPAVVLGSNTTQNATATLTYNPASSSRAGMHAWSASSDQGAANGSLTYESIGSLMLNYASATQFPPANYTQNQTAEVRLDVTTPGPENRSELASLYAASVNASLINPSQSVLLEQATFINPSWSATTGLTPPGGVGVWSVNTSALATHFFSTRNDSRSFEVYGFMNVTESVLDPVEHFRFQTTTQECRVQDQDTAVAVAGAEVEFYRNSTLVGSNTTNSTGWAQLTFQTNESGFFDVTCVVEDQTGIYYFAGDTPTQTNQLEVIPYPVTPTSPANNTQVDRDATGSGISETITLVVDVPSFVPDGEEITFFANRTQPLITNQTVLGANTTSSGQAQLTYNPNTSTETGLWEWAAETTQHPGGANGTRLFEQFGRLDVMRTDTLVNPDANYTQNETALLEFNLTTPGPETREELATAYNAQLQSQLTSPVGTDETTLSFTDPTWSENYNLLALTGVGTWSVQTNASALYSINATTSTSFDVYGFMNVTESLLTPNEHFAYDQAVAACRVQDQHTAVAVTGAEVEFYRNTTLLGTNTTNSTGWAQLAFSTNETGSYDVTCVVEDQPGIYYFAGDAPTSTQQLLVNPFPITPVNPPNGTQVDRDSTNASIPDAITLNVSVPSFVPEGTAITFSSNLTTPDTRSAQTLGTSTVSNGYATYAYNPSTSSYAGIHTWYADSQEGAANGTRSYESLGTLNFSYASNTFNPDANYTQNQTVEALINLTSPGPENASLLASSYAAGINTELLSPAGSINPTTNFLDPLWSASTTLIPPGGVGVWNTTLTATVSHFFSTTTSTRSFDVYGFMNVTESVLTPNEHFAYDQAVAACRVQDQHTAVDVAGAEVEFYRNSTLVGSNTTNSSGWAQLAFSTNETGSYDVTCVVEDQLGIYYFAGDAPSATNNLLVEAFPITLTAPANGTQVDRDETQPAIANEITLNVSVPSFVPDGVVIEFSSNLTDPETQPAILLGTNTTQNATATLTYNPASSSRAGMHAWSASSDQGTSNQTRTYQSLGTLALAYTSNALNPDANYTQNATVQLEFNLTTPGVENTTQLSTLYAASTNYTLQGPIDAITGLASYQSPAWQASEDLIPPSGVGVWNASAQSQATHFLNLPTTTRSFDVYGFLNVTQDLLEPNTKFAFEYATRECRVQDQHTSQAVSDVDVNFYRDEDLLGTNTTNSTGWAQFTFQTTEAGNYSIVCAAPDQTQNYYFAGDAPNATKNLLVAPYPVTPISPANNTVVDRDAVSASVPDTIDLVVEVPGFVPDGDNITFYAASTHPQTTSNQTLGYAVTNNGTATLTYNPPSTRVAGVWEWAAETTEEPGGANGTRLFEQHAGINVTYTSNEFNPDANYTQNQTAHFQLNLTSPGPETRDELAALYQATMYVTLNSSVASDNTTAQYSSPTWNASYELLNLTGVGIWGAQATAQANYTIPATTYTDYEVYGFMNATEVFVDPEPIEVFSNTTAYCRIQDHHTAVNVAGANVQFYANGVLHATATTNSSGWAQANVSFDEVGDRPLTCTPVDTPSLFYFAGDDPIQIAFVDVIEYLLDAVNPQNGTVVDRDGLGTDPDTITLVAQAQTNVPAGRNVTFYANLTSPALGQEEVVLGVNQTNSSGAATLTYAPNASTYAGNWTWYAQETAYALEDEVRTYIQKAAFNVTFVNETHAPNQTYNQTDLLRINATLASFGLETTAQLGSAYNPVINATLTPPTEAQELQNLSYTGEWWSGSQMINVTAEVGVWTAVLQAADTYFYQAVSEPRNYTVKGLSNLTLRDASDEHTVRIFQEANFFANYSDTRNQPINYTDSLCRVRFDTNGTYTDYQNMSFDENISEWRYDTVFEEFGNFTYNVHCADPLYEPQNKTDDFTINRTFVNSLAPDNTTVLDRDGVSTPSNATQLLVNIPNATAGINVTFYLDHFQPSLNQTPRVVGYNITEEGGNATLRVEVNESFFAGRYEYFGEAVPAMPGDKKQLQVFGSFAPQYTNALMNPNESYNQTDRALFDIDLLSPGPENSTQVTTAYNASGQQVLTKPSSINVTRNYTRMIQFLRANYTFGPVDEVGVWSTRSFIEADFFYAANDSLRNFTVFGLTNLSAFDEQDIKQRTFFAEDEAAHYANWTHTDGTPVEAGVCTLTLWDGENKSMAYDDGLWRANHSYPFAGIFRYNVSCERAFYHDRFAMNNISIATNVSLTADYQITQLESMTREVQLTVRNLQNHTERNVTLYTLLNQPLSISYEQPPTVNESVVGGLSGEVAEWYFLELGPFEERVITLNVTGSQQNTLTPLIGVRTPPVSGDVFG